MKYEWIEIDAYFSWQNLVNYVEKIIQEFGQEYTIQTELIEQIILTDAQKDTVFKQFL